MSFKVAYHHIIVICIMYKYIMFLNKSWYKIIIIFRTNLLSLQQNRVSWDWSAAASGLCHEHQLTVSWKVFTNSFRVSSSHIREQSRTSDLNC